MSSLFFLCGTHGVGKSSLARALVTKRNLKHVQASELIRQQKIETDANKRVSDIRDNQEKLLFALRDLRHKYSGDLILDGHLTLLDDSENIVCLSADIFFSMKIDALLLLESSPEIVRERLLKRDTRTWDISKLEDMIFAERLAAHKIAENLRIPILALDLEYRLDVVGDFIDSVRGSKGPEPSGTGRS